MSSYNTAKKSRDKEFVYGADYQRKLCRGYYVQNKISIKDFPKKEHLFFSYFLTFFLSMMFPIRNDRYKGQQLSKKFEREYREYNFIHSIDRYIIIIEKSTRQQVFSVKSLCKHTLYLLSDILCVFTNVVSIFKHTFVLNKQEKYV